MVQHSHSLPSFGNVTGSGGGAIALHFSLTNILGPCRCKEQSYLAKLARWTAKPKKKIAQKRNANKAEPNNSNLVVSTKKIIIVRYRNEEREDPGKFFVFSQAHKAP